jgi:dihydrofolate reductase
MSQQLRVHSFGVSLDGYGAGLNQTIDDPLGARGLELHEWLFPTRTFQAMVGNSAENVGTSGIDDQFVAKGFSGIGATIMGRNMFGPIRGAWPDDEWTGWWGSNPPYHHPVFVLTNHPRPTLTMDGGTTFHFVSNGIESALQQALESADGLDVRLGGGVWTIQQYLRARLVDYMHIAIVPIFLGAGERLLDVPELAANYGCLFTPSDAVIHAEITKR